MKIFLLLTIGFFALAMNTIEIDANPPSASGLMNASIQMDR